MDWWLLFSLRQSFVQQRILDSKWRDRSWLFLETHFTLLCRYGIVSPNSFHEAFFRFFPLSPLSAAFPFPFREHEIIPKSSGVVEFIDIQPFFRDNETRFESFYSEYEKLALIQSIW